MQDYEKIREIKRKAIAYAKIWWDEKPSDGAYECNQCGYQVGWKEEGSSYYLDWIRCKSCTDKTFPEKMGALTVSYLGRKSNIPLNELVRQGQVFSNEFLLNAVADWMYEPGVKKLRVTRKKNGDFHIS